MRIILICVGKTADLSACQSGLKATLPRLRILQLFRERETRHLSAEEIYRFLLDEKIEVGLATIYRALGLQEH